jgi:hypothetical protein
VFILTKLWQEASAARSCPPPRFVAACESPFRVGPSPPRETTRPMKSIDQIIAEAEADEQARRDAAQALDQRLCAAGSPQARTSELEELHSFMQYRPASEALSEAMTPAPRPAVRPAG